MWIKIVMRFIFTGHVSIETYESTIINIQDSKNSLPIGISVYWLVILLNAITKKTNLFRNIV